MKPAAAIASTAAEIGDRTRRQIAGRLLPFLFLLYIVNYVDRTSVAYAALGMTSDLGFSDRVFGLGAGVFFISYVALQIPGAMLVEHWSARRLISAVMIAWGSLTALTGLVHTAHQLYAARLLLGAAEAAFFPGVIVYLSHWFSREDRGKATGYFMSAIPLSQALASPVAGWIVGHSFLGLQGWRWLFILEGLPAILFGAIAYFFLSDQPCDAHWLAPARREWIEQKLQREKLATPQSMSVGQALRSRIVLLLAMVAFLNYFVAYGFYFWFPTMLKRLSGLSDVRVGMIGAIPYVAMFAAMLLNGWHSDKRMERKWHCAIPMFIAAMGALGLIAHSLSACFRSVLYHARARKRISARLLVHSHGAAQPFRCCGRSGNDQFRRIDCRLRCSLFARLFEQPDRLVPLGHGRRRGSSNCWWPVGTADSKDYARSSFVNSNRHTPELELPVTHTKQSTGSFLIANFGVLSRPFFTVSCLFR